MIQKCRVLKNYPNTWSLEKYSISATGVQASEQLWLDEFFSGLLGTEFLVSLLAFHPIVSNPI